MTFVGLIDLNFMGLLNFMFSCCPLVLNGDKVKVGGSLVNHPVAQKANNGPNNSPKSGYDFNSNNTALSAELFYSVYVT